MTPANFLSYAAQVTIVVLACAGLPRLLGLRAPGLQYAFWRTVLVVCLLLPMLQPRRPAVMAFVASPDRSGPARSGVPPTLDAPAPASPASTFDWVVAVEFVMLLGIVARFTWIGLGMVRLRRMRHRATEPALEFGDLQQAIGAAAPILWSSEVRHPVTFGFFDPVVLLPLALKAAELPAQRAVVAHELHHVKRRDWGWIVAEELVRSVFWFHPAVWWLVSRVQLARETVVDELSILVTNARRTYLDTLLAFADDSGLASSPAFSARRHLFYRVMLLSKEGEMSSIRVALGSLVLMLALGAGSWEAVKAFPLYGGMEQQAPPRDPITAEQYHRTAVQRWETVSRDTTLTTDQKRQEVLKGIAAEDHALAIKPDYFDALAYKNILLRMQAVLSDDPQEVNDLIKQADQLRNRALTLRADGVNLRVDARGVPPPPPPPPPPAPEFQALIDQYQPTRVGGTIKSPEKIRDVKPVYPPIALSANVQGVVIIEAILDADGAVVGARVLRSIPLLDEAALAAVQQWRFTPPLVDGVPRAVMMTVTVNFTLQQH